MLQESVTKTNWRDNLHRQESAISQGSRRPQTETIGAHQWEKWRKFKAERHEAAKEKCKRQKEQAASQSSSTQTFIWLKCSRVCASRIGLYVHQRACQNWPSTLKKILVCEEWAINKQPNKKPNKIKTHILVCKLSLCWDCIKVYWPFGMCDKEAFKQHLDVIDRPEAMQVLPLPIHLDQLLKHLGCLLQLSGQCQHIVCNTNTNMVKQQALAVSTLLAASKFHLSTLLLSRSHLSTLFVVSKFILSTLLDMSMSYLSILLIKSKFDLSTLLVLSVSSVYLACCVQVLSVCLLCQSIICLHFLLCPSLICLPGLLCPSLICPPCLLCQSWVCLPCLLCPSLSTLLVVSTSVYLACLVQICLPGLLCPSLICLPGLLCPRLYTLLVVSVCLPLSSCPSLICLPCFLCQVCLPRLLCPSLIFHACCVQVCLPRLSCPSLLCLLACNI